VNVPRPVPGDVLSRSEVAALFRVDGDTVDRWARQGKLPYTLTPGGERRYGKALVLALLNGEKP
jgi:excisionase family DNA binding protein